MRNILLRGNAARIPDRSIFINNHVAYNVDEDGVLHSIDYNPLYYSEAQAIQAVHDHLSRLVQQLPHHRNN